MPRYDYECDSCHHRFELTQRFQDEPVGICPRCHSRANRKISLVPVIFKGSGWYVNEHGKGVGSSADEKAEEKKGEKSTATEKAKTETKAETNVETKKEPNQSKSEVS